MTSLSDILSVPKRPASVKDDSFIFCMPEQYMGVEIEVERSQGSVLPPSRGMTTWTATTDGSLMNGIEYVLKEPLAGKALSFAIKEFFSSASGMERRVTSSTHIHLDMSADSLDTLQTLFCLVNMFEEVLWHVGDPSRKWCGFTYPVSALPTHVVSSLLTGGREFRDSLAGMSRYFGFNVLALAKYGSLEFRYFPTATSDGELFSWIDIVQRFKLAALSIGTVAKLKEVMETEDGYNSVINSYFNGYADVFTQVVSYLGARMELDQLLDTYKLERRGRSLLGTGTSSMFQHHPGLAKMLHVKRRTTARATANEPEAEESSVDSADPITISRGPGVEWNRLSSDEMNSLAVGNVIRVNSNGAVFVPVFNTRTGRWESKSLWRDVLNNSMYAIPRYVHDNIVFILERAVYSPAGKQAIRLWVETSAPIAAV